MNQKTKVPALTKGYSKYPVGEVALQVTKEIQNDPCMRQKVCVPRAVLWWERYGVPREHITEMLHPDSGSKITWSSLH